jgi:hypothetical protein
MTAFFRFFIYYLQLRYILILSKFKLFLHILESLKQPSIYYRWFNILLEFVPSHAKFFLEAILKFLSQSIDFILLTDIKYILFLQKSICILFIPFFCFDFFLKYLLNIKKSYRDL